MDESLPRKSAENIGYLDRTVRVFGGIILLYSAEEIPGAMRIFVQGLGFYGLLTGFLGTCIVYNIFNFSTNG